MEFFLNLVENDDLKILEISFEKAGVAIAHVDVHGKWIRVNQQFCDFLGYTKEELYHKTFQEITYTQDLENDLTYAKTLYSGESDSFSIDKRYIHKSGYPLWANLTATAIRDEYGNIKFFIAVVKDIISQMALKESRHTLKYMLKMSPIAVKIATIEPSGVLFSNLAYSKLIHEETSDVLGKNPRDYYMNPSEYDEIIENIKNQQVIYNRLIKLCIKNNILWVLASYMTINFDGQECILGWFYDITEQINSKEALEQISVSLKRDQLFLQTLIESMPIPIFYKDRDGIYLGTNNLFLKLLNFKSEDIIGKTVFDYAPYEIALKYQEKDQELLDNPKDIQIYEFIAANKKTGKQLNMIFYKKVYYDENNNIAGIIGSALDITQQKETETLLRHQKDELETIFNLSRDGIAILDMETKFLEFNDSYLTLTGFTREELLKLSCFDLTAPQDRERAQDAMNTTVENGHLEGFEKTCIVKDGKYITINMSLALMPDKKRILISTKDVTDIKKHEKQLEYIAHYDPLTGLPNRILKTDRLRQAMLQVDRKNSHIAILYLDLDGFKEVNDTYGHNVGDQLLVHISSQMKKMLREGDTLSRLGGDEFVAIITELDDISLALPLVKRLLEAASRAVVIEEHLIKVSASIGVTFFPQNDEVDGDQLIRQADQAMYEAKQFGKNRYHIFDPAHDKNIRVHHENIEHIDEALQKDEFILYYQPKVNMKTGEIVGAEALIRWNHPKKGLIMPMEFLPIIEEHTLAITLGEWVINTALQQIQEWKKIGLHLHVSVNISAKQLLQLNFIERLQEISSHYTPDVIASLEMEILETSALEDVVKAADVVDRCKKMGIIFSLDDFGTGYSSLSYLRRLPVATLKIDQSFVRNMLDDSDDMAILEGIIGLAGAFKKNVIAEGVETIEHGRYLIHLGCNFAQGYAIARPMPAKEFLQWREKWSDMSTLFQ